MRLLCYLGLHRYKLMAEVYWLRFYTCQRRSCRKEKVTAWV